MNRYDRTDPEQAMAEALINVDLVTEHRFGEARVDASELIDELTMIGWKLVPLPEERDRTLDRAAPEVE